MMNELFEKQMKDILKDEYDDFMVSLTQPNIKAFYLNPQKKECFRLFESRVYQTSCCCEGWLLF